MKRPLLAGILALACVPAVASPGGAGSDPVQPAATPTTVTWSQLEQAIAEWMALARVDQNRWELAIYDKGPAMKDDTDPLRAAARDTLRDAFNEVAWIVTEVTYRRFLMPGVTFKVGEQVKLPDYYCDAFLKTPSFTDPLRRSSEAALRAHGLSCEDCASGIRPTREVLWVQVREYIMDLIYVKEVAADGRIDLQVGRVENGLPGIGYCDQDVASACFSLMQTLSAREPSFQNLVKQSLNQEVLNLGDIPTYEARERLNARVPKKILDDPAALEMIGRWLPEVLARHGLTCPSCPQQQHGGAETVDGSPPKR